MSQVVSIISQIHQTTNNWQNRPVDFWEININ